MAVCFVLVDVDGGVRFLAGFALRGLVDDHSDHRDDWITQHLRSRPSGIDSPRIRGRFGDESSPLATATYPEATTVFDRT